MDNQNFSDEQYNEVQPNNENKPPKSGSNTLLIILAVLLFAVIIALLLVIVSQNKNANKTDDTESVSSEDTEKGSDVVNINYADYYDFAYDESFSGFESADLSQYVKLGEYKGIEVTLLSTEVTDKDIEDAVKADLYTAGKYETLELGDDEEVANGDIVSVTFVGKLDGVEFEGGSGTDEALEIGSGYMIPGFEEGLIGAKKGETRTVDATFPENYPNNPDLAGKTAQFDCTINSISRIKYNELTDEIAAEFGSYSSVDDYKKALKEELAEEKKENSEYQKKSDVWSAVLGNSEFIKYPKSLLDTYMKEMIDYYTSYASYYSYSLEDYVKACGAELGDFYKSCASYAESASKEILVIKRVAELEHLDLTDDEYNAGAKEYCERYSYDDVTALEAEYGKEFIYDSLLNDKVMNFLSDSAIEK